MKQISKIYNETEEPIILARAIVEDFFKISQIPISKNIRTYISAYVINNIDIIDIIKIIGRLYRCVKMPFDDKIFKLLQYYYMPSVYFKYIITSYFIYNHKFNIKHLILTEINICKKIDMENFKLLCELNYDDKLEIFEELLKKKAIDDTHINYIYMRNYTYYIYIIEKNISKPLITFIEI